MKRTKKIAIAIVLFIIILSLSGCSSGVTVTGLENFPARSDSLELHKYLEPAGFLKNYEYTNGDYYYRDPGLFSLDPVVLFLYLEYDEQTYPLAKEYMLEKTDYNDNHQSYNGYEFYENVAWIRERGELDEFGNNTRFPCYFNMIGYNDNKNILVFIGYYGDRAPTSKSMEQGWGVFLKEYYSVFDFDA